MSQPSLHTDTYSSFFQKSVFGILLISIFGIPLFATASFDEGEDKWFLIRVIGPVLVVMLAIHESKKALNPRPLDALAVFALAWLAVQIASLFGTTNGGVSLAVITRQIGLVSFFFLVRFFATGRGALLILSIPIVLVGLATSTYGVFQHFGYDFINWQVHSEVPHDRGISFMGHATFAASVIIMVIPITIARAIATKSRIVRLMLSITAIVMLYHLSFSGARVATVALFFAAGIATLAYFIRAYQNGRRDSSISTTASWKSVMLIFLVIAIGGSTFGYSAWKIKGSDGLGLLEGGLAQRIYAWETANRMFVAHPVNGVGIGNYEVVSPSYWNNVEASRYAQFQRMLIQPHSEYFEAAAETGLPGIAVLLGIVVFALAQTLTQTHLPPILATGIFAAVLGSALDAIFLIPWQLPEAGLIFWVILGMISGQYDPQRDPVLIPSDMEPETQ